MAWTQFMDMHSGGRLKEAFAYCYIEAPEKEAARVFYHRFGHNPHRVSCTCCGNDYSLTQSETLEQATAYNRNLWWIEDVRGWLWGKERPSDYREGRYLEVGEDVPDGYRIKDSYRSAPPIPLATYLATEKPMVIRADEIKPEERVGEMPEQGYVWQD